MLRRFLLFSLAPFAHTLCQHIQHDEYKGQQAVVPAAERARGLLALHFILWLKGAKIK
jgi:hypothetical protein